MPEAGLTIERRGSLAIVSYDGDRLTLDLCVHLADVLAGLADDASVRVALLGRGLFALRWDRDGIAGPDDLRRLSATVQAIAETPLPLIGVIDGDAFDAGFELALACDVRLAADRARFGFPDSTAGLPPLAGGAARLVRLAGRATASFMLLTGESLAAHEALACGLVSGAYPQERLADEAERLANAIAARGPIAVRYAKEAVSRGAEMPLDQALRFETDLTVILQTTRDRAEGVAAFAEKREPRFRGE